MDTGDCSRKFAGLCPRAVRHHTLAGPETSSISKIVRDPFDNPPLLTGADHDPTTSLSLLSSQFGKPRLFLLLRVRTCRSLMALATSGPVSGQDETPGANVNDTAQRGEIRWPSTSRW